MSHGQCFKFSGSYAGKRKKEKQTGGVNFNNIFDLTQYVTNILHVINVKFMN